MKCLTHFELQNRPLYASPMVTLLTGTTRVLPKAVLDKSWGSLEGSGTSDPSPTDYKEEIT